MPPSFQTSLFIFRRDLRVADNLGLNAALAQSKQVIACFILDPRQIEPHPYQSRAGLQFMVEALTDLHQQLQAQGGQLHFFQDSAPGVIRHLQQTQGIDAVYVNRDYTPFSQQRDLEIARICNELGVHFHTQADALLNEPEDILNGNGQPYQVFTAFYKRCRQNPVDLPRPLLAKRFIKLDSSFDDSCLDLLRQPHNNATIGGRSPAVALLEDLGRCRDYAEQRDFPVLSATSDLSAYLKFGCCSVREAYYAVLQQLGSEHSLLRQFYWRDFFHHIAFHFPKVFGHAFHSQYDAIVWRNDREDFQRWADGHTGFPIVDAGMRQLKQTGTLHNRVRMIVASFLVKDLHISWRWGERYFAQHLVDYDPCVNNGNWQWAASTGCDAQPYFRIFNPWLQQQRFDPDCVYIKRWIPELRSFSPKVIQQWHKTPLAGTYPPPMLDHGERSQQAKRLYQQAAVIARNET